MGHWKSMEEAQQASRVLRMKLEKEMATHSNTLAWKIPWTEKPGRLQSMWSQRVGHNWATSLHFTSEGPYPTLVTVHCSVTQSCWLCNSMDCSMPGFPVHHQLPELAQTNIPELVMPSKHLILCCSLLLLPSVFPSIRVFSNESVLHIRWPKYWSFSFSMSFQWMFRTNCL